MLLEGKLALGAVNFWRKGSGSHVDEFKPRRKLAIKNLSSESIE